MPVQDPGVRAKNFDEVALGFRKADALNECERCLVCPNAECVPACPVNIDIPGFITRIAEKDFRGAYDVLTDSTLLPAICLQLLPWLCSCH